MNAARLPTEASKETSSHHAAAHGVKDPGMKDDSVLRGAADPDTGSCRGTAAYSGGNPAAAGTEPTASQSALSECVTRTIRRYLADIGDTVCDEGLHALVIREVEGPLLREVLAFHDGNQSRAASVLGINRATLRKKLAAHGLL